MNNREEALIPKLGVITDVRIDTPDVKTFRVVTPDGKKALYSGRGRGYVFHNLLPHQHRVYGILHQEMRMRYGLAPSG